jgi:hypothetical protein
MNFQKGGVQGLGSKGWDFILFYFINPFSQTFLPNIINWK